MEGPRRLAEQHLSTVLALTSASIVLVRVMAVSLYDPQTTLAVLSSSDLASLIIGSVVVFLPILLPVAAIYVELYRQRNSPQSVAWGPVLGLVFLALLVLTPISQIIATFVGIIIAGVLLRATRKRRQASPEVNILAFESGLALVIATNLVFIATYSVPWLPTETISVAGRPEPVVGYVLGSSSGWTSLLGQKPRLVERIADGAIVSRQLCNLPGNADFWQEPLPFAIGQLLGGKKPGSPVCPAGP